MTFIIDLLPPCLIVLVWLASLGAVVVYTYHKCKVGNISYHSSIRWFIAFIVMIVFSILFGMKFMREAWNADIVRMNNEFNMKMMETNKVNSEVLETANERVVVRTEQKVKVLTKIEKIESDTLKDYYDVLNEASRRPQ